MSAYEPKHHRVQLDLLPPLGHKEDLSNSFKTGGLVTFVHLSEDRQTNTGLYNIDWASNVLTHGLDPFRKAKLIPKRSILIFMKSCFHEIFDHDFYYLLYENRNRFMQIRMHLQILPIVLCSANFRANTHCTAGWIPFKILCLLRTWNHICSMHLVEIKVI